MRIQSGYLLVGVISLGLGSLLVWQVKLQEKIQLARTPKAQNVLAIEVNQLIKDNQNLREEFLSLQAEHQTLVESGASSQETAESLQKSRDQYRIVAGTTQIVGEGVVITYEKPLVLAQLIDLVNALRNIGIDGVSIGQQRIVGHTPVPVPAAPQIIEVVGSKDLLQNALTRRGGVFDQIGRGGSLKVESRIVLPPSKNVE